MTSETREQFEKEIEAARLAGYEEGRAEALRRYALKSADEMNDIVNRIWLMQRDLLQQRANETGQALHQGIPGLPDVVPLNQAQR